MTPKLTVLLLPTTFGLFVVVPFWLMDTPGCAVGASDSGQKKKIAASPINPITNIPAPILRLLGHINAIPPATKSMQSKTDTQNLGS